MAWSHSMSRGSPADFGSRCRNAVQAGSTHLVRKLSESFEYRHAGSSCGHRHDAALMAGEHVRNPSGGDGRLRLSGRLDAAQVDKAEKVLNQVEDSAVCDLGELEYISSAGLGVFVKTHLRLQSKGSALRLVNVQPRVRPIFRYAHLDEAFGIE
jgi:anti-sigma B factor antagonist